MLGSKTLLPFLTNLSTTASILLLSTFLNLPSVLLNGLHTYIHPDAVAPASSNNGLRAAIRRPSDDPKKRPKKNPDFDESNAQLFRLRIVHSNLRTRLFFPLYRLSFVLSIAAVSSLSVHFFLFPVHSAVPFVASGIAVSCLLFSVFRSSFERSATKRSEKQLGVLLGFAGFLGALFVQFGLSPSIFDFRFSDDAPPRVAVSVLGGCLTGLLFVPASRAARSFWIGTDQLSWSIGVVSCGFVGRLLLYLSFLANIFAAILWINPLASVPAEAVGENFARFRVWCLVVSATLQVLVLRPGLQMHLNEAVLSWYQRLHSSKVPDMDFGRAKIFLHDYYMCLVVLQFFAPPALVLLLVGLSQMKGNAYCEFLFVGSLDGCSSAFKEISLFLAWWIVFVWAVFTTSTLALFRRGFLFVS